MHFSVLSKSRKSKIQSKSRKSKSRTSNSQTKSNNYLSKVDIALIITTLTAILAIYGLKDKTNIVYTTASYMLEQFKLKQTLLLNSELGQKIIQFVKTYNPWRNPPANHYNIPRIDYTPPKGNPIIKLPKLPFELFKKFGLDITADLKDLRRAHNLIAKKIHPDMPGGDAIAMMNLNVDYEILKNYIQTFDKLFGK